jgi:DNA-binding IclR family transcriptional regulator
MSNQPVPRRGRPRIVQTGSPDEATSHRVEAVERALAILNAFLGGKPALSLAEISRRTDITPSTVLRLSSSLMRFGYLSRGRDGLFRLGAMPLRLGQIYQESFVLSELVRPALARLAESSGETAAFYVLEGNFRICLYRHEARTSIRHHVEEGAMLPLDQGASAHVLAAFALRASEPRHNEIRARLYAMSFGERDAETAAIAAPVFAGDRTLVGALTVSGLRSRFERTDTVALAQVVVRAAAALTSELGGQWPRGDEFEPATGTPICLI